MVQVGTFTANINLSPREDYGLRCPTVANLSPSRMCRQIRVSYPIHSSTTWLPQANLESSASPFWKAPQRDSTPKRTGRDSGLVVGAAYSHADMLKLDSLYVPRHYTGVSLVLIDGGAETYRVRRQGQRRRRLRIPTKPTGPRKHPRQQRPPQVTRRPHSKPTSTSFRVPTRIGMWTNQKRCMAMTTMTETTSACRACRI